MTNVLKYLIMALLAALLTPAIALVMLISLPLLAAEVISGAVDRLPHGW
jgi:hypothetical protein